jgi:hypothetical protein
MLRSKFKEISYAMPFMLHFPRAGQKLIFPIQLSKEKAATLYELYAKPNLVARHLWNRREKYIYFEF